MARSRAHAPAPGRASAGVAFLGAKRFPEALKLIGGRRSSWKKLDDKLLLVDIHLLESKIHAARRWANMPKAKAALVPGAHERKIYVGARRRRRRRPSRSSRQPRPGEGRKTAYSPQVFEAFDASSQLWRSERASARSSTCSSARSRPWPPRPPPPPSPPPRAGSSTKGRAGRYEGGGERDGARSLKDLQTALAPEQELVGRPHHEAASTLCATRSWRQNLLERVEDLAPTSIAPADLPLAVPEALSQMITTAARGNPGARAVPHRVRRPGGEHQMVRRRWTPLPTWTSKSWSRAHREIVQDCQAQREPTTSRAKNKRPARARSVRVNLTTR